MPDPALPQSRTPVDLPGLVWLRRTYLDALRRPMRGTVTVTNRQPATVGDVIIPASSVKVDVPAGLLEVALPPNTYTLSAQLRTADGDTFVDTQTVTLTANGAPRRA